MKRRPYAVVIGMFLGMFATVVPGCATNRVDLVDQGIVSVETTSSKSVNILWTNVSRDGKETVVYGAVQRRSHTSHPIKTHIDIAISSPDGKILEEARTLDIDVPRRIPGKGANFKRFELRFSDIPPGSEINVVVHGGSHESEV